MYNATFGGAALTREKIVASIAKKFVCIVDDSKWVDQLGRDFPLPVEVIPMARSAVARKLVSLGGDPVYREGVVTDNGNVILDVFNLNILNAIDFFPLHIKLLTKRVTNWSLNFGSGNRGRFFACFFLMIQL